MRGVAVPAELEAVVLACLAKDPDGRPQSAAELRRRIEACAVEPWDSAQARNWWHEHQRDLDGDTGQRTSETRTIVVAGSRRSLLEPTG